MRGHRTHLLLEYNKILQHGQGFATIETPRAVKQGGLNIKVDSHWGVISGIVENLTNYLYDREPERKREQRLEEGMILSHSIEPML